MIERLRIAVEGVVQGVGFRPFVFGLADALGVRGFVTNRAGDVVIEAEGEGAALRELLFALEHRAPAAARVDKITTTVAPVRGDARFEIARSDVDAAGAAAIAPDVATCAACVDEIRDTSGRRAGYAFTSCAACGPRLTIVTAAPYDRARTTMAGFPLCAACRAEHDDPTDRRFHAQPIACPACGPKLTFVDAVSTADIGDDPIAMAAAVILGGGIVAIKGLGGYHLACDATREDAVSELRRRKQRDAKPFAVMVADLDGARELASLAPGEVELLSAPARPIVLVTRRPSGVELAASIAPGMADLGLLLPYTPLHHLLLAAVGGTPLVMTSGNISDEPIAFRDDDALARLGGIADRLLVHDRPIHMRCEDSIARVVGGAPMLLRRARGYAPAPLRLPFAVDRPTLALGGHLKAAFVLGQGEVAFASPHLGDLDELSAYEGFVAALAHFEALHRVTPERIVCDRHPDYATTRLAEQLARDRGVPLVQVQHHHAHFASALADAGLRGPAIGVTFDGAGYGDDGTIWGGEIFVGGYAHARRAAHLRAVPLPGGDRAAEEPWRMAIAHLAAAGESLDALIAEDGSLGAQVAALCARPGLAPLTSSVGRLFDAVAAITGSHARAAFEGQPAMQLEALARGVADDGVYPFVVTDLGGGPMVLEVAPMIRAIVGEVAGGEARGVVARRFHNTVVALAAAACVQLARLEGLSDVVLSGGVFQNAILATELPRRLAAAGLTPHLHRRVPPNDGGLALGQLAVAAARGGS